MNKIRILFFLFLSFAATAQTEFSNSKIKTISIEKDSVQFSKVSISPINFKITHNNKIINPEEYRVDFGHGILYINSKKHKTVTIHYTAYPEFLTKTYSPFDKNLIVPYRTPSSQLFRLKKKQRNGATPFEGLDTQGSLARGFTIGNNQNAVLNSTLDLQVSGKISKDVTLRASISDSNIPIQENGYSQRIEEFDRVYIELFTNKWSLKAGDIQLSNHETNFLQFDKKVAGLSADVKLGDDTKKTEVKASGALVRGQFTRQFITGVEGNQGPYKLTGPNGELFIVILSGSETIYVNGVALKRGEQNDYTIDYNTAEIIFTTTYPITANMRIIAEFQYSDRNYTRFVTYNKITHTTEKLKIGGYFYNENDAKNQPLQQNLSTEQKSVLEAAGNDKNKMVTSSAVQETYDANKIQYVQDNNGNFQLATSNDPTQTYYNVNFQFIGTNNGDYTFLENTPLGRTYEYTMGTGDYSPIVQLVAPTKLQVAVADLQYTSSKKTSIATEIALSNNDRNLFSDKDDDQNKGIASKISWEQIFSDKKWLAKNTLNFDYLQQNFQSIQRVYSVEFSRDWDLQNTTGNQQLLRSKFTLSNKKDKEFGYTFESLKFGNNFNGQRHIFNTNTLLNKTSIVGNASILKNETSLENTSFLRANFEIKQNFKKTWLGTSVNLENNQRKNNETKTLNPLSQKYISSNTFLGIGDSTKIYVKMGVQLRTNDSVKNNTLTKVNDAKNYYIKSQLVQNKKTRLSIYANYRTVKNTFFENSTALNSRILYSQKLFKNFINLNTLYETSSGSLPQQEFTYIKTEPGQGFYTWIDYNNNGKQEFEEFEIAKFSDQASYLRVALPSVNFLKIHQNKFSQSLLLNASQWSQKSGFKKWLSQFSSQSFVLIDSKKRRVGSGFNLNPFQINDENILGLNFSLRNSLFFRRGLQKYSTTYIHSKSKVKNNFGIGFQENEVELHEIQFQHKLGVFWLVDITGGTNNTNNSSQNFTDRNYTINTKNFTPVLTYRHSKNANLSLNYEFKKKTASSNVAKLQTHKLGTAYQFSNPKKGAIIADFNFYKNDFDGVENSALAFQILEGLQPGSNYVWNFLVQKKLTQYLDLNLNYSGRKSDTTRTIHIGNIQLRANF